MIIGHSQRSCLKIIDKNGPTVKGHEGTRHSIFKSTKAVSIEIYFCLHFMCLITFTPRAIFSPRKLTKFRK
jgi:hypothetical protein